MSDMHKTRDIYAITDYEFSDMVYGDIDRFSYIGKFDDVFAVK